MNLVLCNAGHVLTAVRCALDTLHVPYEHVTTSDARLPERAVRWRTIVYAPKARLLDGTERLPAIALTRAVVGAARAAIGARVVAVVPASCSFFAEERMLQRNGIPYTILRSAPLIDELADATNLHTAGAIWLPRGGDIDVTTRAALTSAIHEAVVETGSHGGTVIAPAERIEIVEAIRRAAAIAGAGVRVHDTTPSMALAVRRVHSLLGIARSDLDALCDWLRMVAVATSSGVYA